MSKAPPTIEPQRPLGAALAAQTLQSSPALVIALDNEGRILYFNEACERASGYAFTEVQGKQVADLLLLPEERRDTVEVFVRSLAGEPALASENHWLSKDGLRRLIAWQTKPLNDGGAVVGTIASGIDVTEERRAAQSLTRYQNLFESAPVAFWEEDMTGVFEAIEEIQASGVRDFRGYVEAHPEFVRRTLQSIRIIEINEINETTLAIYEAQSKADLLGSMERVFLPETFAIWRDELVAYASGQYHIEAEAPVQTLRGRRIEILVTKDVEPRRPYTARVGLIDITELKRAQAKLMEARGRWGAARKAEAALSATGREASTLESGGEALLALDAHGRVAYGNTAWGMLWGGDRGDTLDQPLQRFMELEVPLAAGELRGSLRRADGGALEVRGEAGEAGSGEWLLRLWPADEEAPHSAAPLFQHGSLRVELAQRRVTLAGHAVSLTPTEFDVLADLVRHRGGVIPAADVIGRVWGPGYVAHPGMLRTVVWRLRRKIEADPKAPFYIVSVPRVGYLFCPDE